MSLRDTIEGARREAEGNAVGRPKKEAASMGVSEEEKRGFSRSSASKARPVREAGASVRVSSKPKATTNAFGDSTETKEEKRDRKRREREEEDLRLRAYDIILRGLPGYRKAERTFWITLGVGMVFAVISLACNFIFNNTTDVSTPGGLLLVGSLVIGYACIIGGFIYNLVKCRPYRKEAEKRVRGLTDKRLADLFEKDRKAEEERLAQKAAKRK